MYEIRKDGGVIALTEKPNYIRRHADGFYILCEEKDAQGVAVDGTAYCLMGAQGLMSWKRYRSSSETRERSSCSRARTLP